MSWLPIRPFLTVSALVASLLVVLPTAARAFPGPGTVPLSAGSITMISTHADKTSGMPSAGVEGANQVAINDDGSAVAFVSDVPAEELVTDPIELARGVTDNNTGSGGPNSGEDVFVYQKFPGPENPIISLVSENVTGTGTGNAPSYKPVMAPHGLGLVFQSSATDMVSGTVAASQNHIYAWVTGLGSLTGVFLIDSKYNSSDACDCSATDPSISLIGPLGPTVVFEATGGGSNDLVGPGVQGQAENQIYAHSVLGGSNTLVSATDNSTVPNARSGTDPDVGNGAVGGASQPMIASDAPIVVFEATGDDLIDGFDSSNGDNIWEHNLVTNKNTLVSEANSGDPDGTSGNEDPVISNFGTSVAWDSNGLDVSATPFPQAQENQPFPHIYFKLVLPIALPTLMVDTDWTGALACDINSNNPGISGDGLSVAFESHCSDITKPAALGGTTPDNNADADVFERTLAPVPQAAPQLLSLNDTGTGSGNNGSLLCAPNDGNFNFPCDESTNGNVGINFDGTVVTYYTTATDIGAPTVAPPPFNDGSVIVSYPQILTGVKNVRVTHRSTDDAYAESRAGDAVVSKDGSSVAFVSSADNLVPMDTNDYFDVFESDLHNSFFATSTAVNEGAGTVTIAVGRTGNNGTSDSVDVATGDGFDTSIAPNPFPDATEAFQPGDYMETDTTLHFPPGIDVQTFDVPINDDSDVEGPEIFHVSLSPSSAGGSGLPGPAGDAYVEIIDNDVPPQDWSAAVTSVPASAHVGDTVTVKSTITVQAGADDLTVNSLSNGAATSGLDQVAFTDTTPFMVTQGTTKEVTATARVTAAPGTAGVKLQTSIDGSLGAVNAIRTTLSDPIAVTEAVSASLTGAPAHVGLPDQITYTLTLTNNSGTAAQVDVPQAGYGAPTGTSVVSRVDGATSLAANGGTTDYTVTVDVDDADADGTTITQAPSGLTYAMSDIALPGRAIAVSSAMSTVDAPVVAVGPHTVIDHNGGTLLDGDVVDISVTVANTGNADTSATLNDTLTNLKTPTNIKLDGGACGGCSSTTSTVTAPFALGHGASHVLTFSATVKNTVPNGTAVTSSAVVTFSPHTTGTSPTAANAQSLTVGSANVQTWSISISNQPPASAAVGDTVSAKATISVTSGPDDLSVTDLSSGAGTSGLDQVIFGDNAPFTVAAGGSKQVTVTARVTAAPGTGGILLEVSATGALGAAPSGTKTADSNTITSTEAVSATLNGGPASVTTADQISYTLTLTNASGTVAQLTGLPAGLTAPTGTTPVAPAAGSTTVAPHDSTDWTLTVDVDDADSPGTVLTQTPGTVSYAMSAIGLAARTASVTPASVSSTVVVPDTTDPDVTINETSGQDDPTSTPPVHFDVEFNEDVTGFDEADVDLSTSTAGGTLISSVSGGPSSYDVSVIGMTTSGDVIATIPQGAAIDGASNPSTASTSTDNSIAWVEAIASHVAISMSPSSSVYGQALHAKATITVDSGSPAGSVQFAVDGTNVGSPVSLDVNGKATSPALTGPSSSVLTAGGHQVTAAFTPTDPLTYGGSSNLANFVVDQADTDTAVTVHPKSVRATVTALAPGAGSPTGTVTFSIDGFQVGSAPVSGGTAVLAGVVPAGKTRHVGAQYSGSANFTASSGSTARHDPSITAHRSSAHHRTKAGWYRSPVTITFDCATHGAPLVSNCPDSVTLHHNGAAQVVSRTVKATNGGLATVNVHVNLDRTDPHVHVSGVTDGGHYPSPGPTPKCVASDALSGIASCVVQLSHHGSSTSSNFRVVATDKAGNTASVHGSFSVVPIALQGVPFEHGAYTVQRNHTYLLVVHSATRPTFLDAAPFPQQPFHPDPFAMRSAGHHRWVLPITMKSHLSAHRFWNIGVQIGSTVHVLKIRVLP